MLRAKGKRLVFVTNNSTKSRKQYGKKFESLGITVSEEEIFLSSFAAAAYLQSFNFPKDKKVKNLSSNNRLLETELEKTKNQLNEAKAVAVDEAEKSKAAKKVIKSLTSQDTEGALVANIGSYMGGVSVSRTWHLGTIQRAAKESLGHAAAILTDVLENAGSNHDINALQKRALLQDMAFRLS
ncbi:uncharacterized protein LOC141629162 isoform X2 [Silene latifolia]|uniref:uncharacterized protein LOC141629162 isoform X2 n=1 Tax=Silene latifolia TaxID=37657 RepID=UPI003D76B635